MSIPRHSLLSSLMLVVACGGDSLSLTATPTDLAADGLTRVELIAAVTFRGGAIADGQDVFFSADAPLLFETLEDMEASVPGGRAEGESEIEVSARAGSARAYLLAPKEAMVVSVTASHTTVNKDVLADTRVFDIAPPPLIANGKLVDASDPSPESLFHFRCDRHNVGAFVETGLEIRVSCYLETYDAKGTLLPHTPAQFFAEAGQINDEPATDKAARTIIYVVPPVLTTYPRDVDPTQTAIDRGLTDGGSGLIPNAQEQNPRDGLVTLLAVVKGHEVYFDANGNGQWDPGEFFIDDGEPFLDVDDDGIYTPGVDEMCCDSNGNGTVDGPNGKLDSDVWLGRVTTILWSGPIYTEGVGRTEITPKDANIVVGDEVLFVLRAVDQNFNPVAALDDDDEIRFELDDFHVDFEPPGDWEAPLSDISGFDIVRTYPSFDWWQVTDRTPDLPLNGSFLTGREWHFVVQDAREPDGPLDEYFQWSVSAEIRYTPGDGTDFEREIAIVTQSGCLMNSAGVSCP